MATLSYSELQAKLKAFATTGAAEMYTASTVKYYLQPQALTTSVSRLRRAAAIRERAAAPPPTTAVPHPLKILLHDLCRAVYREQIGPARC